MTPPYTTLERNLTFANLKKTQIAKYSVEETMDPNEVGNESIVELADNEDILIIETSVAEVKVIETLEELECALEDVLTASANPQAFSKAKITVPFDLNLLTDKKRSVIHRPNTIIEKRFLARIGPDDAAAAEAELSRQISQSDFEKVLNFAF